MEPTPVPSDATPGDTAPRDSAPEAASGWNLARALAFARHAHTGQVDKVGRDYYNTHILDVVERAREREADETTLMICALHDTIEDVEWVDAALLVAAGCPAEVVTGVELLTRSRDVAPEVYYARIREVGRARLAKECDIASNADPGRLALIPDEATRERLRRKYEKARTAIGAGE